MKKIFFILVLLWSTSIYAINDDCDTTGSGDFSVAGTWQNCGGSIPGTLDSALINAGHTVTVDGDTDFGRGTNGYGGLEISGTLLWPDDPGASWLMEVYGNIEINNGGKFMIGDDSSNRLDCDYTAEVQLLTGSEDRIWDVEAGGQLLIYGCEGYGNDSGVVQRALISSCNPDCNAGAGKTITLDRVVDWATAADVENDALYLGVGGLKGTAGTTPEEINTWTTPSTSSITVALTQMHNVGDIVAMGARNVLLSKSSANNEAWIEIASADNFLSWLKMVDLGENGNPAITATVSGDVGTYEYIVADQDNIDAIQFKISGSSSTWTKIDHITVWDDDNSDAGVDWSIEFNGPTRSLIDADNMTYIGINSDEYGIEMDDSWVSVDGFWCSHSAKCIRGSLHELKNSLFHESHVDLVDDDATISLAYSSLYENKFYNCVGSAGTITGGGLFYDNEIYCDDTTPSGHQCWVFEPGSYFKTWDNLYDACNGVNLSYRSNVEMHNESFGTVSDVYCTAFLLKEMESIYADYGTSYHHVCNDCSIGTIAACTAGECDAADMCFHDMTMWFETDTDCVMAHDSYMAWHNEDQVEGAHYGFGPGGMEYEREIGTFVDNTVNLRMRPHCTSDYSYIEIGSFHSDDGDTVDVDLQLRKDESQSAGYRPRLALEGCGFNRIDDYDEMSDAVDTWEAVEVTGTAAFGGVVHILVGVRNEYDTHIHDPDEPPTVDVFVDGLAISSE